MACLASLGAAAAVRSGFSGGRSAGPVSCMGITKVSECGEPSDATTARLAMDAGAAAGRRAAAMLAAHHVAGGRQADAVHSQRRAQAHCPSTALRSRATKGSWDGRMPTSALTCPQHHDHVGIATR